MMENKSSTIIIRVPESMKELLSKKTAEKAKRIGVPDFTLSEYVRYLIISHPEVKPGKK